MDGIQIENERNRETKGMKKNSVRKNEFVGILLFRVTDNRHMVNSYALLKTTRKHSGKEKKKRKKYNFI